VFSIPEKYHYLVYRKYKNVHDKVWYHDVKMFPAHCTSTELVI